MWKSNYRLRHKIFFWMLLYDRVSTRNLLQRRKMHLPDYNCALCSDATQETLIHLFWNCHFSLTCWNSLLPNRQSGISAYDEIMLTITMLPKDIAMEIIILGCWSIWMVRNGKIFRAAPPSLNSWKFYLREGLQHIKLRSKQAKGDQIDHWIE